MFPGEAGLDFFFLRPLREVVIGGTGCVKWLGMFVIAVEPIDEAIWVRHRTKAMLSSPFVIVGCC